MFSNGFSIASFDEYYRQIEAFPANRKRFLADPVGRVWDSHRQAVEHVTKAQQEYPRRRLSHNERRANYP
jgi:hypothetical protein